MPTLDSTDLANILKQTKLALYGSVAPYVKALLPSLHLRMDAATGIVEKDLSGGGHDATYSNTSGTLTGVTLDIDGATSDQDTAVQLSGGSLTGSGLPAVPANGNFTFACFLYVTANPASFQVVFEDANGAATVVFHTDGNVYLGNVGFPWRGAATLPQNQWVLVVLVQTSAGSTGYSFAANGTTFNLNGFNPSGGNSGITAGAGYTIGAGTVGSPFQGGIDEVMVFANQALTFAQAQTLYTQLTTPIIGPKVNVGKWQDTTVSTIPPNAGPVALTTAAYQQVAQSLLGSGLSTSPGGHAVYNRLKTLPFFTASRYERTVFVMLGDSNQVKDDYGWNGAFQKAFSNTVGNWGTGLLPVNNGGGATDGYLQGGGSSDASIGAPSALDIYMPGGSLVFNSMPSYAYRAAGEAICLLAMNQGHPIDLTGSLRYHLSYGVDPSFVGGSFHPGGRYNGVGIHGFNTLPALYPAASILTNATNSAIVDGSWDLPAGSIDITEGVEWDFGDHSNSNGAAAGPTMFFYWQIENRSKLTGTVAQTLAFYGGQPTKQLLILIQGFGQTALKEYFRQSMLYAGPNKLCCIRICEGVNDMNYADASWVPDTFGALTGGFTGSPSNTAQGFANNTQGLIDQLRAAWTGAGFDINNLYFVITPSHPQDLPDYPALTDIRRGANILSDNNLNTSAVHLDILTSYTELVANSWYLDGPPSPHLNANGYDGVAAKEVQALQPTGAEVVLDASIGALTKISVAQFSGPAKDLREMVVQLYRLKCKKSTLDDSNIKMFADDELTVIGTIPLIDDGTIQTKGSIS